MEIHGLSKTQRWSQVLNTLPLPATESPWESLYVDGLPENHPVELSRIAAVLALFLLDNDRCALACLGLAPDHPITEKEMQRRVVGCVPTLEALDKMVDQANHGLTPKARTAYTIEAPEQQVKAVLGVAREMSAETGLPIAMAVLLVDVEGTERIRLFGAKGLPLHHLWRALRASAEHDLNS